MTRTSSLRKPREQGRRPRPRPLLHHGLTAKGVGRGGTTPILAELGHPCTTARKEAYGSRQRRIWVSSERRTEQHRLPAKGVGRGGAIPILAELGHPLPCLAEEKDGSRLDLPPMGPCYSRTQSCLDLVSMGVDGRARKQWREAWREGALAGRREVGMDDALAGRRRQGSLAE